MSLYGWPGIALVVCQQASCCSKDQRCASQTHSSPPVSLHSLQLRIPTSPPPTFLLFSMSNRHLYSSPTQRAECRQITAHCREHYVIIHLCVVWFNHTATIAVLCSRFQALPRTVALLLGPALIDTIFLFPLAPAVKVTVRRAMSWLGQ